MRLLQTFVASRVAEAIGWTLVHSLWEGAVISAVLGVLPSRCLCGPPLCLFTHTRMEDRHGTCLYSLGPA
jgi:hypothetical protein